MFTYTMFRALEGKYEIVADAAILRQVLAAVRDDRFYIPRSNSRLAMDAIYEIRSAMRRARTLMGVKWQGLLPTNKVFTPKQMLQKKIVVQPMPANNTLSAWQAEVKAQAVAQDKALAASEAKAKAVQAMKAAKAAEEQAEALKAEVKAAKAELWARLRAGQISQADLDEGYAALARGLSARNVLAYCQPV